MTALEQYLGGLSDKRVGVIGAGVSNMPLIRMLRASGVRVTVHDKKEPTELGDGYATLATLGVDFVLGEHYLDALDEDVIFRNGRITTGTFTPHTTFEHWWRKYPFYRSYYEDTPTNYDDLFSVAKAFGVTTDEVQALLDYGCSEEEIEEMLYDPELFHEMTGELLYAY